MAEKKEPKEESAPARGAPAEPRSGEGEADSGDVDPELLSIRGPRPRIGVLLSLSIIVLCVYLLVRIGPDLRFALADAEPLAIADPAEVASAASDSYVEIESLELDRAAALRVSHSADPALATGHRLVPALATGGALWVAMDGNPRLGPVRHGETHAGRLRDLADLPFAEALRERAAERGSPRFATAAALRRALEAEAGAVEAPAGDSIEMTASTPVTVAESVAGRVEITAVATRDHPSAESWARALQDAGALPGIEPPVAAGEEIWVFEAAGSAAPINETLSEARLVGASAEQVQRIHEVSAGDLSAAGGALRAGDRAIPWDDIDGVWLEVARPIPAGAAVLIAGEHPRDYRHALWIAALLAAFALLFAWAFIDGVRREIAARRPPPPPSKSDT